MAKALLISLCVHAVLVGVLWHVVASRWQPSTRELRVDLAPAVRPTPAVASSSAPVQKTDSTQHAIKGHPDRVARARAPLAPRATPDPGQAERDAGVSVSARETPAPQDADAVQAQPGAVPIDLRVVDWLARYRSYPLAARRARLEGVVQLRVTLLPDGRLIDARVERSSGHALLDQAALDLLARAAPLPDDFGGVRTAQIELQLPIVYRMRASST